MENHDVAIIGAGPYGLSAAAHLQTLKGLNIRVFGEPMAFWKHHMPSGMYLRSPFCASHIADPQRALSLDAYLAERGNHLPKPIPLSRFLDYGNWYQQKAVPNLDRRNIRQVECAKNGFQLITDDGEILNSRRVVVAAGPGPFAWRPEEFSDLPPSLASHSTDHHDLGRFSGKRVLVVGAGQSALENAALLHESGADVDLVVRSPKVHWLRWKTRLSRVQPLGRLLYSPRDVGPAGVSQLIARPDLFKRLPRRFQDWASKRALNPAGSVWVMDRLCDVPIRTGLSIKSAAPVGGQLRVTLSDGTEGMFDHIIFATGFKADLAKYRFLGPQLLRSIDQVIGYPRLKAGLECSVPGLHFLGAPSGWSFGPLARFVSGTFYSPRALTRKIAAES